MKNQVEITEMKPVGTETYKVYKIRRKTDGLFSTGGCWPLFTAKGKEWYTPGAVASHLAQMGDRQQTYGGRPGGTPLSDVEIVTFEYEVRKFEVGIQNGMDYFKGLLERREKRVAAAKKKAAKRKLEDARRELERATAKLQGLMVNGNFPGI